jgi:hypothetical protein
MKLGHGLHLGYCTNIHRGETWAETFNSLRNYTLAVRDRVCPGKPYGIGLRLSNKAAVELNDRVKLLEFQRWLTQNHCYVFTINGFPYGAFHGTRIKEQVYLPDWTSTRRVTYTNLLFDLLAQLLPGDVEGSVSTVPCGFKELITTPEEMQIVRDNIWSCVQHAARLSAQTGRQLHLGLEPEPMCVLETSGEVIPFFERMRAEHPKDPRLGEHLGINYDTCHLAIEFEEPRNAMGWIHQHGIKLSKIHLSSALRVRASCEARDALKTFAGDVYFHQVVIRRPGGECVIYRDLHDALAREPLCLDADADSLPEWRIHFHIPLHNPPTELFDTTTDHILGVLDIIQAEPHLCSHLEMETYTWEVLPQELKSRDVVDQLVAEYDWTLARLAERDLCPL